MHHNYATISGRKLIVVSKYAFMVHKTLHKVIYSPVIHMDDLKIYTRMNYVYGEGKLDDRILASFSLKYVIMSYRWWNIALLVSKHVGFALKYC